MDSPSTDADSVRAWLRQWSDEVAGADIAAGRERFADDLIAFGTHADVVRGRDEVEAEQWSKIWPAIDDFRFDSDSADVLVSTDRLQAVIVTTWQSTGIAADGGHFPRPGRATIVVRRATPDAPWLGVHTHFSLARGVPQSTHGHREARR
jgi:ketosteroid isomerase-like protein